MLWFIREALLPAVGLSLVVSLAHAQDKPSSPDEQDQALLKEYQTASSGWVRCDEAIDAVLEPPIKATEETGRRPG